jgi:hypothetical protein
VFHVAVVALALLLTPRAIKPPDLSQIPIELDLVAVAEKTNPPPPRGAEPRPPTDGPAAAKAEVSAAREPETRVEPRPQLRREPIEAKPPPQLQPEVRPVVRATPPRPEPEAKPKPEPKPEPEAKPKLEPKPEPEAEKRAEPKPEAKPQPRREPEAKPKPEAKPEPKPEAKPVVPARPEPVAKPLDRPSPKPEHAKSEPAKPETSKPEPAKPETAKPEPAKPKPPAEVAARAVKETPAPAVAKALPAAAAKAHDQPPADRAEPTADFSSVVKTVGELRRDPPRPAAANGASAAAEKATAAAGPSLEERVARALGSGPAANQAASHNPAAPVTQGELDAVRRQIERCWSLPAAAKDADGVVVAIRVQMNADGTPRTAVIDAEAGASGHPLFRVAAESALRAVLNPRCHPFKLPPEKYERWRTMTLVFNPKEMFGT